jgi:hypothetical protein
MTHRTVKGGVGHKPPQGALTPCGQAVMDVGAN